MWFFVSVCVISASLIAQGILREYFCVETVYGLMYTDLWTNLTNCVDFHITRALYLVVFCYFGRVHLCCFRFCISVFDFGILIAKGSLIYILCVASTVRATVA